MQGVSAQPRVMSEQINNLMKLKLKCEACAERVQLHSSSLCRFAEEVLS